MVGSRLISEEVDGKRYWFSESALLATEPLHPAYLLPTYDEVLVGCSMFAKSRTAGMDAGKTMVFDSTIVIGGRGVGSWRRTFKRGSVFIELAPFAPLNDAETEAVTAAAHRYGAFLEMPVVLA